MATVRETMTKLDEAVKHAESLRLPIAERAIYVRLALVHATALSSDMLHDDRPIWEQ